MADASRFSLTQVVLPGRSSPRGWLPRSRIHDHPGRICPNRSQPHRWRRSQMTTQRRQEHARTDGAARTPATGSTAVRTGDRQPLARAGACRPRRAVRTTSGRPMPRRTADPLEMALTAGRGEDEAERRPYQTGLDSACGNGSTLWIRESLPVGWGDTYFQFGAGQSFNFTSVPNGPTT